MYKHHEDSCKALVEYYKAIPGTISVILAGSVAKGLARTDSDIDAVIVVTDERFALLESELRLSECIYDKCTYEGGYFDVKYCTADFIKAVATRGTEPARSAFTGSYCLYGIDPEIDRLIPLIPVYQKEDKADKQLSFYSALKLNEGYFWRVSKSNPYLRSRVVAEVVLFGLRLVLAENEVLFPSHKALVSTVSRLPRKPEGILGIVDSFLERPGEDTKKAFVDAVLGFCSYTPPENYTTALTRFIDDNELWWYKERPMIAEW